MYQVDFPSASNTTFPVMYDAFPNSVTVFTVCFWAKILKTKASIFGYSIPGKAAAIAAYLNRRLFLQICIDGVCLDPSSGFVLYRFRDVLYWFRGRVRTPLGLAREGDISLQF